MRGGLSTLPPDPLTFKAVNDGGVKGCGAQLPPQINQNDIYMWNNSH